MIEFTPRVYYKLTLTLRSPLSVGSGNDNNTDHDCIVDSEGKPFLPATTIAGVLRHALDADKDTVEKLFGRIAPKKADTLPSKVIFYDGHLAGNGKGYFITARDCVRLEEKVAASGAKFDLEAVETCAVFIAYAELTDTAYTETFENLLAQLNAGILRFGAKTTRGYGQVGVVAEKKLIKNFAEYAKESVFTFKPAETLDLSDVTSDDTQITLTLEGQGGISVREYSTDVGMPDFTQLALHDKAQTPIIPGTSWAGAFRERFTEFAGEDAARELFGYVDEKTEKTQKSRIRFTETSLTGGTYKTVTRNAIDRFTNSTKDGALYTERTYYNGIGELTVTLPKNTEQAYRDALAACVADLHCGLLSVGGEGSIGRGLFKVTAVNGKPVTDENIYETVKEGLQ